MNFDGDIFDDELRADGLFGLAVDAMACGVIITDARSPDDPIIYVNRAFERITGYGAGEAVGRNARFLQGPDRTQPALEGLRTAIREGKNWSGTLLNYRKDGVPFWQDHSLVPVRAEDGSITHHASVMYDITARQRAEERLRDTEALYRTLVEQLPTVTYVQEVGGDEKFLYVSPQIEGVFGYSQEEVVNELLAAWEERLHPEDRDRVLAEDQRTSETLDPFRIEYRERGKDGRYVWVREEAVVVRDEAGNPLYWQGFIWRINDRKELEERLAHQALHDPLTGLPNRRLFTDRLEHATARASRNEESIAVLFLDLDGFKEVNDSLGHEAGDELLVAVASRLSKCLRPGDTISRLGGDEFVVLLEEIAGVDEAEEVAERISRSLHTTFVLDGREVSVTASIGIATSGPGDCGPTNLLQRGRHGDVPRQEQGQGAL